MKKTTDDRGKALLFVALTVLVGAIVFVGIYSINAKQNYELANTIGSGIDNTDQHSYYAMVEIGAGYHDPAYPGVVWTEAHADKRHNQEGALVQDIYKKCNESNGSPAIVMHNPKTGRDAFVCFLEGYWVVTIKNFDPAKIEQFGDDVVTAFDRADDLALDDVIAYLERGGYIKP
jgi:hypothetical protein